jgi:hypothetical protein
VATKQHQLSPPINVSYQTLHCTSQLWSSGVALPIVSCEVAHRCHKVNLVVQLTFRETVINDKRLTHVPAALAKPLTNSLKGSQRGRLENSARKLKSATPGIDRDPISL